MPQITPSSPAKDHHDARRVALCDIDKQAQQVSCRSRTHHSRRNRTVASRAWTPPTRARVTARARDQALLSIVLLMLPGRLNTRDAAHSPTVSCDDKSHVACRYHCVTSTAARTGRSRRKCIPIDQRSSICLHRSESSAQCGESNRCAPRSSIAGPASPNAARRARPPCVPTASKCLRSCGLVRYSSASVAYAATVEYATHASGRHASGARADVGRSSNHPCVTTNAPPAARVASERMVERTKRGA
mmetsp:Transcript_36127/g.94925  ORF Transcript_36127/g.94925 Transcript_36127/m.94925 type:complete len:246 (-) Transcript_36127:35-772(-)